MRKTLLETYMGAFISATMIPWRIYGAHSRKLLCEDYGALTGDCLLDNMQVVKCTKKNGYWRITVKETLA